jgi:hypothetical protein
VVERGGLENRCTVRYRGFESLLLRNKKGLSNKDKPFFMDKIKTKGITAQKIARITLVMRAIQLLFKF